MRSAALVRLRTPDDDAACVALSNALSPEFPPNTVEESRYFSDPKRRPEGTHLSQYVADESGQVVACGELEEMWETDRSGAYYIDIAVARERQGRTIGSLIFDRLLQDARDLNAVVLHGRVREDWPNARAFATAKGFEPTGHSLRMSRLNVHTANLEGYGGLLEQLEGKGIRIETLAEAGTDNENLLRALHEMISEAVKDEPSSEPIVFEPFDLFRDGLFSMPGSSPDWLWLAFDGNQPVGAAFLRKQGEDSAFNNGTDVARPYRRRGIARALKLRQIQWARDNGVDYLYTGNDVENRSMLSINIRLGYQPLPSRIDVKRDLTT